MSEIINEEEGSINLAEMSRQNGLSELENMKKIITFLAAKAEFYDENIKVQVRFKKEAQADPS
uniref:Uncharacterized protein n=1 Tax=viral metagenome TaxID=1070528 RepID=A0A6M3J7U5_9ZZZZ